MISFIIEESSKTLFNILINSLPKELNSSSTNPKTPENMHILQPKHTKLKEKESEELLEKLNISKAQIPKILSTDPGLPEGCSIGDVIKIERKEPESEKINTYHRVVV